MMARTHFMALTNEDGSHILNGTNYTSGSHGMYGSRYRDGSRHFYDTCEVIGSRITFDTCTLDGSVHVKVSLACSLVVRWSEDYARRLTQTLLQGHPCGCC
jgi:hypothetical protein